MANHHEANAVLAPTIVDIRTWDLSAEETTYLEAAEQLAASLAHESRDFDLPRQLVHGDFWASNVYLSGDQLTLLLDLDFLGERPRVDDLALTLFFINDHLGRNDTSPTASPRSATWSTTTTPPSPLHSARPNAPPSPTQSSALL